MAKKAKLVQGGDGTAVPSGMVGEMFGTERAGTGGSSYTTETTTAATTVVGSLVSVTLKKGIYLISGMIQQRKAANTNADSMFLRAYIGGTAVIPSADDYLQSIPGSSGIYTRGTMFFPCTITTDDTVVAIYGRMGTDNAQGGRNILTAIRII